MKLRLGSGEIDGDYAALVGGVDYAVGKRESDGIGVDLIVKALRYLAAQVQHIVVPVAVLGGVDVHRHIIGDEDVGTDERGGERHLLLAHHGEIGGGVDGEVGVVLDVETLLVSCDVRDFGGIAYRARVRDRGSGRGEVADAECGGITAVGDEKDAPRKPDPVDVGTFCRGHAGHLFAAVCGPDEGVRRLVVDDEKILACGKECGVLYGEVAAFGIDDVKSRIFCRCHACGSECRKEHHRNKEQAYERKDNGKFRQRLHNAIIAKRKSYVKTIGIC